MVTRIQDYALGKVCDNTVPIPKAEPAIMIVNTRKRREKKLASFDFTVLLPSIVEATCWQTDKSAAHV